MPTGSGARNWEPSSLPTGSGYHRANTGSAHEPTSRSYRSVVRTTSFGQSFGPALPHLLADATTSSGESCCVCLDRGHEVALVDCGHKVCNQCCDRLVGAGQPCPLCRRSIQGKVILARTSPRHADATPETMSRPATCINVHANRMGSGVTLDMPLLADHPSYTIGSGSHCKKWFVFHLIWIGLTVATFVFGGSPGCGGSDPTYHVEPLNGYCLGLTCVSTQEGCCSIEAKTPRLSCCDVPMATTTTTTLLPENGKCCPSNSLPLICCHAPVFDPRIAGCCPSGHQAPLACCKEPTGVNLLAKNRTLHFLRG